MASQEPLRKQTLMEMYRLSGGDIEHGIQIAELSKALNQPPTDVVVIVKQLVGKNLVKFLAEARDPVLSFMNMTMRGIEEAERLELPSHRRFATDHPVIWPLVASLIVSVTVVLVGKLLEVAFRPPPEPQHPPIIHNIIQLPDANAAKQK